MWLKSEKNANIQLELLHYQQIKPTTMKKSWKVSTTIVLLAMILMSCQKNTMDEAVADKWKVYTTADGMPTNRIYSVAVDSSANVWVGTDKGAAKFDGVIWSLYNSFYTNSQVTAIAIDANGDKWFGTYGGGVTKVSNTTWTYYTHDPNNPNSVASNKIRCITIDAKGNKWIGTDGNGVSLFDGSSWTNYTTKNGLADDRVYCIAVDKQGNKWFGTNGGASKYDGTTWTTYSYTGDKTKGIAGNGVMSIAFDNQGNTWFATFGGLSKFDGSSWTTYGNETEGLKAGSPLLSIKTDRLGKIWVGYNGWGISSVSGTQWDSYSLVNQTPIDAVNAITIDNNNNKWFGTNNGLLVLKN